ncbi:hypothetical protein A3C23_02050 [Candidatus Roizmanbacteria bacterium RIFCSPHIGHO2_02_FULL_37_13b]|uniref:Coenzyme A biosynthesis bifunctional protein CoaBC n=1 Tax=Candidatus Roizmanbacteria bacterium RIFCSPLOWO2_02_FULL_36_11 TaxID=1802071 RepID=A0A1F7JBS0_9BACT|nr:MAG: hypothetical protein A3C23_02050 [Candidatus Roizmanbacteria bacterium RIFCSPHIGHO2_02_FULL_37_13b]OGK53031.1 MAG: hypothetical protein A3H78_02370 [Candidatus Roizmanbacteria bacterium RIFCSPLOWO2_02_FULL_36_11]
MKKNICLGITGGIAAYKILDLIKLLKKDKFNVKVIMTYSAQKIIPSSSFKKLGIEVYSEMFVSGFDYRQILKNQKIDHIEISRWADIIIIAPATANFLAKIANGLADDLLSTTLLATNAPIVIFPSMNSNMWHHPLVQKNLQKLIDIGYHVIDPDSGQLACNAVGMGRLPNIKKIKSEIEIFLQKKSSLEKKRIIVTAGATEEKIDPVRIITNKSSGKMGLALAEICYLKGYKVLLLRASSAVKSRHPIPEVIFENSMQLSKLIKESVQNYDIIFHTAAVSDFAPKKIYLQKMDSSKNYVLNLIPQNKIIRQIKKFNPNIYLVAFKATYKSSKDEMINKANQLLADTQADAILVNDLAKSGVGFRIDTNEVYLVRKNKPVKKISLDSKLNIARKIIAELKI